MDIMINGKVKEIYLEDILNDKYLIMRHISILRKMLKKVEKGESISAYCPYNDCSSSPCRICNNFIGIVSYIYTNIYTNKKYHYSCPCVVLGEQEAIRKTIEAIAKYDLIKKGVKIYGTSRSKNN